MTDEQIIKRLKFLHRHILQSDIAEQITESEMLGVIEAIDLIRRQKEEKEEQFRRLGNEIYVHCSKIVDLQERLAFERAEAIREFLRRIECESYAVKDDRAVALSDIYKIARDMTEGQK